MASTLKVEVDTSLMIEAVKKMGTGEREEFIEDLLAATSPEYLESIREAREDYSTGRVHPHSDIFGE